MHKNYLKDQLPEIIFASSEPGSSRQLAKLLQEGLIRKLVPKVYTSNMEELEAVILKRNLWPILSFKFPNSILTHRSALEFKLSPNNNIYITGNTKKVFNWFGLKIKMIVGPKPIKDDTAMYEQLYV